jgi:hypothetical protein
MINVFTEKLFDALEVTTEAIVQAAESAVIGLKKGAEHLYTDVIVKNLISFGNLIKNMDKNGINTETIALKKHDLLMTLSANPYLKPFGYLIA